MKLASFSGYLEGQIFLAASDCLGSLAQTAEHTLKCDALLQKLQCLWILSSSLLKCASEEKAKRGNMQGLVGEKECLQLCLENDLVPLEDKWKDMFLYRKH